MYRLGMARDLEVGGVPFVGTPKRVAQLAARVILRERTVENEGDIARLGSLQG
jgi:hypothetical protein